MVWYGVVGWCDVGGLAVCVAGDCVCGREGGGGGERGGGMGGWVRLRVYKSCGERCGETI